MLESTKGSGRARTRNYQTTVKRVCMLGESSRRQDDIGQNKEKSTEGKMTLTKTRRKRIRKQADVDQKKVRATRGKMTSTKKGESNQKEDDKQPKAR
jgi:hypothetical protein